MFHKSLKATKVSFSVFAAGLIKSDLKRGGRRESALKFTFHGRVIAAAEVHLMHR